METIFKMPFCVCPDIVYSNLALCPVCGHIKICIKNEGVVVHGLPWKSEGREAVHRPLLKESEVGMIRAV